MAPRRAPFLTLAPLAMPPFKSHRGPNPSSAPHPHPASPTTHSPTTPKPPLRIAIHPPSLSSPSPSSSPSPTPTPSTPPNADAGADAHRWSDLVPPQTALTFAALYDPAEGLITFSGPELLPASSSLPAQQPQPHTPSILTADTASMSCAQILTVDGGGGVHSGQTTALADLRSLYFRAGPGTPGLQAMARASSALDPCMFCDAGSDDLYACPDGDELYARPDDDLYARPAEPDIETYVYAEGDGTALCHAPCTYPYPYLLAEGKTRERERERDGKSSLFAWSWLDRLGERLVLRPCPCPAPAPAVDDASQCQYQCRYQEHEEQEQEQEQEQDSAQFLDSGYAEMDEEGAVWLRAVTNSEAGHEHELEKAPPVSLPSPSPELETDDCRYGYASPERGALLSPSPLPHLRSAFSVTTTSTSNYIEVQLPPPSSASSSSIASWSTLEAPDHVSFSPLSAPPQALGSPPPPRRRLVKPRSCATLPSRFSPTSPGAGAGAGADRTRSMRPAKPADVLARKEYNHMRAPAPASCGHGFRCGSGSGSGSGGGGIGRTVLARLSGFRERRAEAGRGRERERERWMCVEVEHRVTLRELRDGED
ncbi:hypothetical protein DENSPDRAFT_885114 [Dentipellis sp. KUC8613]|nr:hypothetical protein DENSPDRAFT_885114 [Dentipellis sp. KUC8613]